MNQVEARVDLSHELSQNKVRNRSKSGRRIIGASILAFAATIAPSAAFADSPKNNKQDSTLPNLSSSEQYNPLQSPLSEVIFDNSTSGVSQTSDQIIDSRSSLDDLSEPSVIPSSELIHYPFSNIPYEGEVDTNPDSFITSNQIVDGDLDIDISLDPSLGSESTPLQDPTDTPAPLEADPSIDPTQPIGYEVEQPKPKKKRYRMNLFSRFNRFQPNNRDCVSTTVENILNDIAENGNEGPGFRWRVKNSVASILQIRKWTRAHDTLSPAGVGSDAVGMRNALNYFGWGKFKNVKTRVYEIKTFLKKKVAKRAIVEAIAKTKKPVALITWNGRHVEEISGFIAYGLDPATSNEFRIENIRVSDPWPGDGSLNRLLTNQQFTGNSLVGLTYYHETDSPYRDQYPETPKLGKKASWRNVYGKIVALIPKR